MNGIFEAVGGLNTNIKAKPFVKWAGGKTQLLDSLHAFLPAQFDKDISVIVEPFVGGGAFFIWILQQYDHIKKAVINDSNKDLIQTYKSIKKKPKALIEILSELESTFHDLLDDKEKKEAFYYEKRSLFNERSSDDVFQSALFIFLNKTCFNGLYRVNRANAFNVPIGRYKKPNICDSTNIMALHKLLKRVTIMSEDYEKTYRYASDNALFYFDPPYKPLSKTSSFTSYGKDQFNDVEQQRLKLYCDKLHLSASKWIMSNSDPKDKFFDELYESYHISRIQARRNINSRSKLRGKINELLITNYPTN